MRITKGWRARLTCLVAATLLGSMTLSGVVGVAPAQAATAGLTGGYASGNTTYAKAGDVLTLSVTTDNVKCVLFEDVTNAASPVVLGSMYDTNNSKSWAFNITAPTASDGPRSVRATPSSLPTAPSGLRSGTVTTNVCGSAAGNDTAVTATYRLANTKPTITGSHAPAAGTPAAQNGWYRGDVRVSWACQDESGGAGLKAPGCPAPEIVTGEGANLARTGSVSDNVGNTNSDTVSFKIDRTAPLTTAVAPDGWQKAGVTVTLSATDNLSTVAKTEYSLNNGTWTTGSSITLGEGQHTLDYRSTDVAGNVEAIKTAKVDIDTMAPTISSSQDPAKPASGWNKADVNVNFICGDNLSGVKSCTAPQLVTAEGTTIVPGSVEDNAGHTSTLDHSVSIDKTNPTITSSQSGTQGKDGWYRSDVTVVFTCADPGSDATPATGSGIASCPESSTVSTQGAGNSVSGNASDNAGNTSSATVSGIKVDKSAPTTVSDAPSAWQKEDVTVHFAATDQEGLSGVDYTEFSLDGGQNWTQGASVTLDAGTHDILFRSADNAGNVEAQQIATVQVDKTPPTITGAPDRAPVNGWYNEDVTVSFICADAGGSSLSDACPTGVVLGEGDDQSVTRSVSDNAGNTASATVGPIRIDKTAPSTTANNPTGWQKSGVTVNLSASDNLSGVASTEYRLNDGDWTSGTEIDLGEGEHTITFRSTDVAGNREDEQTATVDIDLTAPTITSAQAPVKNTAGWNNTDVTVSFICGDSLSGVTTCTDPRLVTAEGSTPVSGEAADNAGNTNSIAHTVQIDKTAPTIAGSKAGTKGANGWYTGDVDVTFVCDDDRSGVAECIGSTTLTDEGAGQSVIGNATDAAENTATTTVPEIHIDKSAPTTSSNAPTGWQGSSTTVSFTAQDQAGLSGVDYTEYSVDGNSWIRGTSVTLADGNHQVQFRSVDKAGNTEEVQSATVQVDLQGPSVSLTGPSSTAASSVVVSGTTSDLGSGVNGVTVNGDTVTLNTDGSFSATVALLCGSNTVTAVASDRVGLSTSASHSVTRDCAPTTPTPVWTTQGFFAPVEQSTPTKKMVNTVKGGSTVPLKFRVYKDGVEQKEIGAIAGMKVSTAACDGSAISDPVDQLTSGSTSLRYDGSQFIQNWKTPTALGCYVARVDLVNGSAITADFRVTK